MSSTQKKWLTGCGIGCAFILLLAGGVGTCGYFGVKRIVEKAENLETGFDALEERYGSTETYTPDPSGRIAGDRLEVFLAIRREMEPSRDELATIFLALEGKGEGGVVTKIRSGLRLVPSIMEFIAARNRVMLEEGMGVGEYQHIYTLAYFVLLNKDPGDGPGFTLHSRDEEDEDDEDDMHFRWQKGIGDEDEAKVRHERERTLRQSINESQREILANQLAALEARPDATDDPEWPAVLAAEVQAMRDEFLRLPWETGLPPVIRDSLEPYRYELDESYNPLTGVLEMGIID